MNGDKENKAGMTLADVLGLLDQSNLSGTRRRDMVSAIKRICEMAGAIPASLPVRPPHLRGSCWVGCARPLTASPPRATRT
jgi:hypothetical protein